jgi:antirestriction protein ArdC
MSKNIKQEVTGKIMDLLKSGTIPWVKPWVGGHAPRNYVTKRPYRGINSLLLSCGVDSEFLTFKQCSALGGRVKKGEKSQMIVFWAMVKKKDDPEAKPIPFLKYFNVFGVSQCEGLPESKIEEGEDFEECRDIDETIAALPDLSIAYGGTKAFYLVGSDTVTMPPIESFKGQAFYYGTLAHEIAHWTGDKKRLNRDMSGCFGSRPYAKEELIAEIASAQFLMEHGMKPEIENVAAYCQSWLSVLSNDENLILAAAGSSAKAVDFMMQRNEKTEEA